MRLPAATFVEERVNHKTTLARKMAWFRLEVPPKAVVVEGRVAPNGVTTM